MQIIVKNIYQREETFEVNLEDNISVLASLIKERFNYENNVKLIYIGKVLLHEIPMKNYFNENLKTILICLEDKSKPINKFNQKTYIKEEEEDEEEENEEDKEEEDTNNHMKIDNIRAIIYAFFTLVSNDTALNYLFFNNPKTIYSLLKNGHLDDLIKQFMEQSEKISDILESGNNESIDIELTSTLKLNVLGSILSESTLLEGFIKK
jgi:hypothetical protein